MTDLVRITAGTQADDRPIGLELPHTEQETKDDGSVTTDIVWTPVTFASPAMLPREARRLVIRIINGDSYDPEDFLLASAADAENRRMLTEYLSHDGVSLEALGEACTILAEALSARPKARLRR